MNQTIVSVVEDDLVIHDEFVESVLDEGQPWVDQDFSPEMGSLYCAQRD